MNWLKELTAGLLAGTLLACLAFPAQIESLPKSFVAVIACLLSVAVTATLLRALKWPRVGFEFKLSTATLVTVGAAFSVGLGLFLWRLTLRVSELFSIGLIPAGSLVFVGALLYFSICYYLFESAAEMRGARAMRELGRGSGLRSAGSDRTQMR